MAYDANSRAPLNGQIAVSGSKGNAANSIQRGPLGVQCGLVMIVVPLALPMSKGNPGAVRYTRRSGVRIKDVGNETLVLDDQGGAVHQLNPTASFIWRQCDGMTSSAEMVRLLAENFEVDNEVAARDVAVLLGRLRELKLVVELTP